jgi:hypothetical protein
MFKENMKMYVLFRTPKGEIKTGYYYLPEASRWREIKKGKNNFRIHNKKYSMHYYRVEDVDIIAKSISEKKLKEKYPQYFI